MTEPIIGNNIFCIAKMPSVDSIQAITWHQYGIYAQNQLQ